MGCSESRGPLSDEENIIAKHEKWLKFPSEGIDVLLYAKKYSVKQVLNVKQLQRVGKATGIRTEGVYDPESDIAKFYKYFETNDEDSKFGY